MYNIVLIKSNKKLIVELYNLKKKITLPFKLKNDIFFDKNSNCISFEKFSIKKNLIMAGNKLNKLLFNINNFFFEKVKFKGKGFRVRFKRKNEILKFTFGHSHINYIFINNASTKIKKLGKYKYVLKCKEYAKLHLILKTICSVKPINIYTKRGIRTGRQVIYKRKGKKSTYI